MTHCETRTALAAGAVPTRNHEGVDVGIETDGTFVPDLSVFHHRNGRQWPFVRHRTHGSAFDGHCGNCPSRRICVAICGHFSATGAARQGKHAHKDDYSDDDDIMFRDHRYITLKVPRKFILLYRRQDGRFRDKV